MARKRHSAEQIINKLREAEVHLGQGMSVPEVARKLGVTEQTYYRWRKEYGGLKTDQARKLKDLKRKMPGSRSWSLIFHSTKRCSRKSLRETSKPAPETRSGRGVTRLLRSLRAAGVQTLETTKSVTAVSTQCARR